MPNTTSVLMAEAAAMAMAASIISALRIQNPVFLTDNQELVSFFNGDNHDLPPRWEIKPYTQLFINCTRNNAPTVGKIARGLNTTAHELATQAFRSSNLQCNENRISCVNISHLQSCPLLAALNSVCFWGSISLIAAKCC